MAQAYKQHFKHIPISNMDNNIVNNEINNETGNYNSFVFTLKGERERILTQVTAPEKRPAALQQELGFSRPPVPPEQVTEMRNKPQNAPRRNHNAPRPGV